MLLTQNCATTTTHSGEKKQLHVSAKLLMQQQLFIKEKDITKSGYFSILPISRGKHTLFLDSNALDGKTSRLGLQGFNKRYAKKGEAIDTLEIESQKQRTAEARVKQMLTVTLSAKDWEERLHDLCMNGKDQRLIIKKIWSACLKWENHRVVQCS